MIYGSDLDYRGWLSCEDLGDAMPRCATCDRETLRRDAEGAYQCPPCADTEAEAAWERRTAQYYGSASPQTVQEWYDAARARRVR